MRKYLIATRGHSHSISQLIYLTPFRVVKNGFNRSVMREMNRPKAANRLVSCCTPFLVVRG